MKPSEFSQANGTLLGGPGAVCQGVEIGVADLPVYRNGEEVISCWKLSWRDRFRILLNGCLWLRVLAPRTHAPVCLQSEHPFEAIP